MSKRGTLELLEDILYSIERILDYTEGMTYENFSKSRLTQDAVVRNFQILGEAAKKLPAAFKEQHKHVPWSSVSKFRDKLVHHYSGVNYDVVFDIIEDSLPELLKQIKQIVKKVK